MDTCHFGPESTLPIRSSNPSTTVITEASAARVTELRNRLKLSATPYGGGDTEHGPTSARPGTSHTTDTLQRHEYGGGLPTDTKIYIGWQVSVLHRVLSIVWY